MSHTTHVQQEDQTFARELPSGIFRSGDRLSPAFLSVGVLGCEADHYAMPRAVLTLLASHLGGEISEELPPFMVACTDGMVIVLTLRLAGEFMGSAVLLTAEQLEKLDKGILELWMRLPREQDAEDFFKGTAFHIADCLAYLPPPIEAGWKSAFC
jgi:hypothetical protein